MFIKSNSSMINKIIYGDAVEVMKNIGTESIDLVVTSPPYDNLRKYNDYVFDFENIAKGLFRIIKNGGVVVWVVGDKINKGNRTLTSFRQALYFQELGFNVHDVMIYRKKNTPFMRSNAYTNCYEFMFVFSKRGRLKPLILLKPRPSDRVRRCLCLTKKQMVSIGKLKRN